MAILGSRGIGDRMLEEAHRQEGLKRIEELQKTVPKHQKADVDRLWELVRDASRN